MAARIKILVKATSRQTRQTTLKKARQLYAHEQVVTGRFLWLRESQQKQKRGRDIGKDPILAAKLRRVFGDINKMHKAAGVRCVR
jgi:hypothetical protein